MNSAIILPPIIGLIAIKTLSALKPLEIITSYIADLPLPVASKRFENFERILLDPRDIRVSSFAPTPNPFCSVICPDPVP